MNLINLPFACENTVLYSSFCALSLSVSLSFQCLPFEIRGYVIFAYQTEIRAIEIDATNLEFD